MLIYITSPQIVIAITYRIESLNKLETKIKLLFYYFCCFIVCSGGFGLEVSGVTSIPSGITLSSSNAAAGKEASGARLKGNSAWCASVSDGNQYLQVDLGKISTVSGLAVQGDPVALDWVKEFHVQYGRDILSFSTYQQSGIDKVLS